ncbi:MAG: DsbA family protein [bacterium]|nr:DsbA family protein [bacterium]
MKNQPIIIVLVILVVVSSFLAGTYFTKAQNLEKKAPQVGGVTPQPQQVVQQPAPTALSSETMAKLAQSGWSKGNKDAKVTIVEFSDFECPFCGRYNTGTYPQIDKDYIQTNKIHYVFQHFPLPMHPNAQKSAEAAECAGEQGKFWEMHDKLFANQTSLSITDLKKYAADLGLKTSTFNSCLDSGKEADKVKSGTSLGQGVNVSGTPAFFINGQLISGAQPYQAFKTVIDQELAK